MGVVCTQYVCDCSCVLESFCIKCDLGRLRLLGVLSVCVRGEGFVVGILPELASARSRRRNCWKEARCRFTVCALSAVSVH